MCVLTCEGSNASKTREVMQVITPCNASNGGSNERACASWCVKVVMQVMKEVMIVITGSNASTYRE